VSYDACHIACRQHVLTISFVRVPDGWVSGTLDPCASPDCACTLITTFTGHLNGSRITGTFVKTAHQGGRFDTGRWNVQEALNLPTS
jgi:hypothetical protein